MSNATTSYNEEIVEIINTERIDILIEDNYSNRFVAKQWIVHVCGFISLVSSGWIIYDQMIKRRKEKKKCWSYTRSFD